MAARLAGVSLVVPPLAERREDISPLVVHFLSRYSGGRPPALDSKLLEYLILRPWRGNVRELELLTRRLLALHGHEPVLRRTMVEDMPASPGGSSLPPGNSYRSHVWKQQLQRLADTLNLSIHVSHFPPGTSKWNKVEHRLFSFISINWRGRPLRSYETVINLISNTKNRGGLVVRARLDRRAYPIGKKVSARELSELNIERADFHGDWNYVIRPRPRR